MGSRRPRVAHVLFEETQIVLIAVPITSIIDHPFSSIMPKFVYEIIVVRIVCATIYHSLMQLAKIFHVKGINLNRQALSRRSCMRESNLRSLVSGVQIPGPEDEP